MRGPKFEKSGIKQGTWSAEEDQKLVAYIKRYGIWNWTEIPKHAGLSRIGKSCRLRWVNYLCPNIKRGNITQEEEDIIISLHQTLGNKWSTIASKLPGRTDNEIKNYWHGHLKKRVKDYTNNISVNAPKFSNSEGSCIPMSSPYTSMSESTPSNCTSGPSFGLDEEQKMEVNNNFTEQNEDLQCFWEELPFLYQDLDMKDGISAIMDPNLPQEHWYQEPLSPYTFNMCESMFNILIQADMNGEEEPNNDFF